MIFKEIFEFEGILIHDIRIIRDREYLWEYIGNSIFEMKMILEVIVRWIYDSVLGRNRIIEIA